MENVSIHGQPLIDSLDYLSGKGFNPRVQAKGQPKGNLSLIHLVFDCLAVAINFKLPFAYTRVTV